MSHIVKPMGATVCSAAGCSASVRATPYRYCKAHLPEDARRIVELYGSVVVRDVRHVGGRNPPLSQDLRILELIRDGHKTRSAIRAALPHLPIGTLRDAVARLKAKGCIHTVRGSYYELGPEPKCRKKDTARPVASP